MKKLILWLIAIHRIDLIESEYINLAIGKSGDFMLRGYVSLRIFDAWRSGFDLSKTRINICPRLDISIQVACFCLDFDVSTKQFFL